MTAREIEVWFDFASTYSHITAQTIEALAEKAGVSITWRPFLLGPVFQLHGMTDSPFNINKTKGIYMWRDMERQCKALAVPFRKPTTFPHNSLKAARIATAADGEAWQSDFIKQTFLANFYHDLNIADEEVLKDVLAKSSCPDIEAAIASTNNPEVKNRLRERTDEAIARGIFGAPTLFVGDELFWGSDRIDQAIQYALN